MNQHHSMDSIHSINDDGHEEPLIFESRKSSIVASNKSSIKNYDGESRKHEERSPMKGLKMELGK